MNENKPWIEKSGKHPIFPENLDACLKGNSGNATQDSDIPTIGDVKKLINTVQYRKIDIVPYLKTFNRTNGSIELFSLAVGEVVEYAILYLNDKDSFVNGGLPEAAEMGLSIVDNENEFALGRIYFTPIDGINQVSAKDVASDFPSATFNDFNDTNRRLIVYVNNETKTWDSLDSYGQVYCVVKTVKLESL